MKIKKKIKDLTKEEIEKICNHFDKKCEKTICHHENIGVCPLKTSIGIFGKCILKTKEWEIMNREIDYEID